MIWLKKHKALAVFGLLVAGVSGCAGTSAPTNFYTLAAIADKPVANVAASIRDGSVGVGPIVLPPYLDRQEIVLPTSTHRRDLAEFDQWIEPLKANMTRVLAENVAVMSGVDAVYGFPWSASIRVDTQILVDVVRFDGVPGKEATLVARWTAVKGDSRKIIASRRVQTTMPVPDEGFEALAASLSQALATLSQDIVKGLPQN